MISKNEELFNFLNSQVIWKATTKLERSARRKVLLAAYKKIGTFRNFDMRASDFELLADTINIALGMLEKSALRMQSYPDSLLRALGNVISSSIYSEEKIELFFFASYAVGKNNCIDENLLLKRKQYSAFDKIGRVIESLFQQYNLIFEIKVVLPDLHHEFSKAEYEDAWELNKKLIQKITRYPVWRLSEFDDYVSTDTKAVEERLHSSATIRGRLLRILNPRTLSQFGANKEKADSSILYYSSIGRWLEDKSQKVIVLDVQKKEYPYQQPFYNALRTTPLPVISYRNLL